MGRFWYTNKEYAQMIYELTGVWADRATYTDDNSEYRLFYYSDKSKAIKDKYDSIAERVTKAEGGDMRWSSYNSCLILTANERS